jgi:hypothetical protein
MTSRAFWQRFAKAGGRNVFLAEMRDCEFEGPSGDPP